MKSNYLWLFLVHMKSWRYHFNITLTNLFRKIAQLLSNGLSDLQVKLILRISQGKTTEEPLRQFPNNHVSKFIKSNFPAPYSALAPRPIKLRSVSSKGRVTRPLPGLWLVICKPVLASDWLMIVTPVSADNVATTHSFNYASSIKTPIISERANNHPGI